MKSKPLLSICVPTYNRKHLLERLYKSIISQNFDNIELIIVDDGSTDGTQKLVNSWKKNSRFSIRYYYQQNSGRAVALKKAIELANGEYTIIMDDDDYFKPGSLELISNFIEILDKINMIGFQKEIVGLCGLCGNIHGNIIGTNFPEDCMVSDFIKIRGKYKVEGDKKEIVKTEILKSVLYTSHERRVPTSLLWTRVAKKYQVLFINKVFVIKDYQPDGMTKSNLKLKLQNPYSLKLLYKELIETLYNKEDISFIFKLKIYLKYTIVTVYIKLLEVLRKWKLLS